MGCAGKELLLCNSVFVTRMLRLSANMKVFTNKEEELDVVPVARLEVFRALKLSDLESFRTLKSSNLAK